MKHLRTILIIVAMLGPKALFAQRLTTTQPTVVCDTTTISRCATVTVANAVKTDGSASTQPISGNVGQTGTWTVQPGNTPNTTPWLASISQGGNTATVSATNALKVDGSAVTQPVSGNVGQSGTWTFNPGNTANTTPWLFTINQGGNSAAVNSSAALMVSADAAKSITTTMQNAATAIGAGTALATDGQRVARLDMNCSVTCAGVTITITGQNNTSFTTIRGMQLDTGLWSATFNPTNTRIGVVVPLNGEKQIRAEITAYGSGTITIVGTTNPTAGVVSSVTVSNTVAGSIADGADQSLGGINDAVCTAGSVGSVQCKLRLITTQLNTVATNSTTIANLTVTQGSTTSGQALSLTGCAATTAAPSYSSGQTNALSCDLAGSLRVNIATGLPSDAAESAAVTSNPVPAGLVFRTAAPSAIVNGDVMYSGGAIEGNAYAVNVPTASTTFSASDCIIVSAATNNATNCKNAAGNLYGYELYNTTTTTYYLRMYNLAASSTCTSATGFIRSIPIPPAGAAGQVGGAITPALMPVGYGTGIGYCITSGSSSTDNGSAVTGIFGVLKYK